MYSKLDYNIQQMSIYGCTYKNQGTNSLIPKYGNLPACRHGTLQRSSAAVLYWCLRPSLAMHTTLDLRLTPNASLHVVAAPAPLETCCSGDTCRLSHSRFSNALDLGLANWIRGWIEIASDLSQGDRIL